MFFLTIYKKKKKLLVSVNLKPHERRENKLFVFLSRWYVLIKHLSCAYTFFVFSRNVFFYADTKFSSHVLLSFNSLLFFKIMLNVDKKPLCGARKQRWLVSVAWKRKKKKSQQRQPSNNKKTTSTTTTKKIKTIFQEGNFSQFSDSMTFFVWRWLCVFEGNFFSLTHLQCMLFEWVCICWKMK